MITSLSDTAALPLSAQRHHRLLDEVTLDAGDLLRVGGRNDHEVGNTTSRHDFVGNHRRARVNLVEIMRQALAPHRLLEGLLHARAIVLEEAAVALEYLGRGLEADGRVDLHGRHHIKAGDMGARLARQRHRGGHQFREAAHFVEGNQDCLVTHRFILSVQCEFWMREAGGSLTLINAGGCPGRQPAQDGRGRAP
jgi:hypothetical protein